MVLVMTTMTMMDGGGSRTTEVIWCFIAPDFYEDLDEAELERLDDAANLESLMDEEVGIIITYVTIFH